MRWPFCFVVDNDSIHVIFLLKRYIIGEEKPLNIYSHDGGKFDVKVKVRYSN